MGGGGCGDLVAGEKLHNAGKRVLLYKRTQIAVKTKTFTILASDETIIIPKLRWNPSFSPEPPRATKIGSRNFENSVFAAFHHLKSSPTFSVRPCSSVGRVTVDLIRRSWVRFQPRSKDFFLCLVWFPVSLYWG